MFDTPPIAVPERVAREVSGSSEPWAQVAQALDEGRLVERCFMRADHELTTDVACLLLETELRRVAARQPALTQHAVSELLRGVDLYELPPPLFVEAGLLPGADLRSLDALHLAAAIRLEVEAVITYDVRMTEAATALGVTVLAPA